MLCGFLAVVVIPTFVFACCPPKQWEGIEYTALGSTGADGKTHYTEVGMSLIQKTVFTKQCYFVRHTRLIKIRSCNTVVF